MATTLPTARRRGRGLRILLIVVLALVALVIVADRVGEQVAENVAADKLQSSQHLPSKPDVDITGFPFLTQVAESKYDEVDVTAKDIPLGSSRVLLSQVRVALDELTTSRSFDTFHVQRATARGTMTYADLSKALGVDVTYAGNGKLKASKKITIFGQTITPTVTARAEFANDALSFAATQVNGLGDLTELAGDLARVAQEVFGDAISFDSIPFKVKVQKISVDTQGLELDLAGNDLTYSR